MVNSLLKYVFLDNVLMISLNDFKNIIYDQNESSKRQTKINKLKEKMVSIVGQGHWDFDDIFQYHNYASSNSTIFDCVVYFLSGEIKKNSNGILLLKIMMI